MLVFFWLVMDQDIGYSVIVIFGQDGVVEGNSFNILGLSIGDMVEIFFIVYMDGFCGEYEVVVGCSLIIFVCLEINVLVDIFICNGVLVILDFVDIFEWSIYSWFLVIGLSCIDCLVFVVVLGLMMIYQLIIFDVGGCMDIIEYIIYVQQFFNSYILDGLIIFCFGEVFELCMLDGDIYYWIGLNVFIVIDQCLSFSNIIVVDVGNYYVFMWSNGCWFIKVFILVVVLELEVKIIFEL